jgi:hypothetical protein
VGGWWAGRAVTEAAEALASDEAQRETPQGDSREVERDEQRADARDVEREAPRANKPRGEE